jgi:biopolymer transport protein ExbD
MAIRERKARTGAIPEGGMADIAFLLLVFFLVTTTIDMDKGLGIILPAEGQELEINKKNILNCLISSSGCFTWRRTCRVKRFKPQGERRA